jgi:hypothetical protein
MTLLAEDFFSGLDWFWKRSPAAAVEGSAHKGGDAGIR